MDWFLLLLAITAVLRGLGSGMITGIIMVTFPVRRKLDLLAYVTYTRIEYKGKGVRVYVATTFLGAILLGILSYEAFLRPETPAISWLIIASFIATVLGLVGAFKAFPAMAKLWKAPDDDEVKLVKLLERFEYWGTFSALGHLISFIVLVLAWALMGHIR